MINKYYLTLSLLILISIFHCGLIKQNKNIKILRVTANIPCGFQIKIKNEFKSKPWLGFCGGVSMNDGSFIPKKEYKVEYIKHSGETVEMPLTWIWKSFCEWMHYSTRIILTDTTGVGQILANTIYSNLGDVSLQDTMHIRCKNCINPCLDTVYYYAECKDSLDYIYGTDIFYSLSERNEDTVNLTINMYFQDDSIYLCNDELRECYEEWKAGE